MPLPPANDHRRASGRPALLTTDIGADMDDQWLLAHLVLAPEVDLRGVVTTHAPNMKPPAAETAVSHARAVLDVLPNLRKRPPVQAGSSVPLRSATEPLPNPGVRFLLDASRTFTPARRLVVCAAGAATDVASALLLDSGFADRVEIIAMGFERWSDGGDPWNVKNDPRVAGYPRFPRARHCRRWAGHGPPFIPLAGGRARPARRAGNDGSLLGRPAHGLGGQKRP